MGCNESKPKDQPPSDQKDKSAAGGAGAASSSSAAAAATASAPEPKSTAELWVESVAGSYWTFVCKHCQSPELRRIEWISFTSTCCDLMKKELDIPAHDVKVAIDAVTARRCVGAPVVELERVVDARIASLLEAWTTLDLLASEEVDASIAAAVLKKAKVYRDLPVNQTDFSFGDIVELTWAWCGSHGIVRLYDSIALGADFLTPEQVAQVKSHGSDVVQTALEAKETVRKLMGGYCTKLRFIGFFGHPSTNDVLDPKKAANVWQDMSHPLTHYSISTQSVTSLEEASSALLHGTRALVAAVTGLNEHGVPTLAGAVGFTLPQLLGAIRREAFTVNPLPIVLCFLPSENFTVAVQDATASCLMSEIGPLIAPGLMFRGSAITDPKFAPSGLQHRVLLMAQQGPLKPFVGLGVADTMRNGLGVRVTSINEGTPASRAGIAKSDWLTHFNGDPIENLEDLKNKMCGLTLGEPFRIRKEGMTDLCGIVGAIVTQNTENVSKKFSDLLFLNYTNHMETAGKARLPWDTDIEPLPSPAAFVRHGSSTMLLASSNNSLDGNTQSQRGGPYDPHNHFRFITRSSLGNADGDEREMAIAEADLCGVQFIDHAGPAAARWARGKFAENGHCGYVLQHHAGASTSETASNSEDVGAAHDSVHSTSSDDGGAHYSVHFEVSLLSRPRQSCELEESPVSSPTSPLGSHELVCSVAEIGTPERKRLPFAVTSTLDVRDAGNSIVLLRTTDRNGKELEAALPAHLIRSGYRVVSFVDPTNESGATYPVLCDVQRRLLRPAVSRSHSAEDLSMHLHQTGDAPAPTSTKQQPQAATPAPATDMIVAT